MEKIRSFIMTEMDINSQERLVEEYLGARYQLREDYSSSEGADTLCEICLWFAQEFPEEEVDPRELWDILYELRKKLGM